MRAEAGVRPVRGGWGARDRRGRPRAARRSRLPLWTGAGVAALVLVTGVVYAGSPTRIPAGVHVAGADVGGLTVSEARVKLARLGAQLRSVPVTFTAGDRRFAVTPSRLEVRVDWAATAAEALDRGDGPLPLRGLERLRVRLFGADVEPRARAYDPALDYEVNRMASVIDSGAREAAIRLQRLRPMIVPAEAGSRLDRHEAKRVLVAALAAFDREPVALPVEVEEPAVTREVLLPVVDQVRTALSAPVRLLYPGGGWTIRPADLAPLLQLPVHGGRTLRIGGPAADRYFANLARGVHRSAVSADFAVAASGEVRVVPAHPGRDLAVAATEAGLLRAAARPRQRSTPLVVARVRPPLTTAEARALRIERVLASYTTLYSGTSDRIQNLQRAVALLDGARIAPGAIFSFNRRVGPRTEERGFRSAPVIMNGEYEEGIGGGTSQVATTLFNAAWEAGLRITDRTAHALYISRYPAGRDATVNYPDVDLEIRNDTGRWIVLEGAYDESGISIGLLGAGPERRVVTEAGPLEVIGQPPVERTPDPDLFVGERVIDDLGEPAREIAVERTVYENGKVLSEETWYTSYDAEPRLVRFGTKPEPIPEPPPPPPEEQEQEPEPAPEPEEEPAPEPEDEPPATGTGSGSG